VFGVVGDGEREIPMGIRRPRDGKLEAQVQGNRVHSSARLAEHLPVLSIHSSSFELVAGGPRGRRQFMDWGVFHVEHAFHPAWLATQRALKQRNMLLRHGKMAVSELAAWDARLTQAGEALDGMRRAWFERFEPVFQATLNQVQAAFAVDLRYARGWETGVGLAEALQRAQESDRKRGFTGVGPQRADLKLRVAGVNAADVLSRGQQKLVVIALMLAQGRLLGDDGGKQSVYLVDDLPAELDAHHRQVLCDAMIGQQAQVLVTCVDARDLEPCWRGVAADERMTFHVEQGRIQPA
jgi:DNA replication and repair protein RecF